MSKQIVIRVRPDGSLSAETHGMKGDDCLSYIPVIEVLTDAATVRSHFTSEYHETDVESENNIRRQQHDRG